MKKTQRYLVTYDRDGDVVIWELYADLTVRRTALTEADMADTDKPIIDLR